jgi:transposase
MGQSSSVVLFGASGFTVTGVVENAAEVVLCVELTDTVIGCTTCGVRAVVKDRRACHLRDAPAGDRPVRVVWNKRVWGCPDPDCDRKYWSEQQPDFVAPGAVLTVRAKQWALARIAAVEMSVAAIARVFGVSWSTIWAAVIEQGKPLVDAPDRVGVTPQIGFDETVMQPAARRRRRRFITSVVDILTSQIIDIFEGHDAADLDRWLSKQSVAWRASVRVVSIDPHEGYRKSLLGSLFLNDDLMLVVDPFHIVKLANEAVTKTRLKTQNETLGHRGRNGDPLYGARKLMLIGQERLDTKGKERLLTIFQLHDPKGELFDAWHGKEKVRAIYLTKTRAEAMVKLNEAISFCCHYKSGPELQTLGKTLKKWGPEILARHETGASNGKVEAANLLIKQIKRAGRGFRNVHNYRLRILLAGGIPCQNQQVTKLRPKPRLIA